MSTVWLTRTAADRASSPRVQGWVCGTFEALPYGADRGALVKPADQMEQQSEVTHVATQLFPAVVLLAAVTTLVPVAAAETAPKSIADEYIEIQRVYANYAHALDRVKASVSSSTFVLDREFT